MSLTYLVPLRRTRCCDDDLFDYLNRLAGDAEVILVDGSPEAVFANHARQCDPAIVHIPVDLEFRDSVNGKAAGVMTGLRRASNEAVVIADDDVRYDASSLAAIGIVAHAGRRRETAELFRALAVARLPGYSPHADQPDDRR